jgi:hypothetical protein
MPKWSVFRLFPVDHGGERLDGDDHAYTFDWEAVLVGQRV